MVISIELSLIIKQNKSVTGLLSAKDNDAVEPFSKHGNQKQEGENSHDIESQISRGFT